MIGYLKSISALPVAYARFDLEDVLMHRLKTAFVNHFWVFIKQVRHLMHELITRFVALLRDPHSARMALIWVLHKWVCTSGTLIETIVSETWIAHANGTGTFLDADTMMIAVFLSAILNARARLFTVTILVAVIAMDTFGTIISCKEGMTDTDFLTLIIVSALSCA